MTSVILKPKTCFMRMPELWKKGKGEFGRARARGAWSRALIPFPFPFERLPRRLWFCALIIYDGAFIAVKRDTKL